METMAVEADGRVAIVTYANLTKRALESDMEIGFNVTYLIDVLNVLNSEKVQIKLKDSNSSAIMSDSKDSSSLYVVMPMRL